MRNLMRLMTFLSIVSCCLFAGCGAHHQQMIKSKPPEDPTAWSGSPVAGRDETTSETAAGSSKGFFKSTRLPGAMSSEGTEIERSLGVGR